MKNFVAPGNTITVVAPASGVLSGELILVGAIAGVANGDAVAGAPVELSVEGVFDLAKTPGDAFTQGGVAKAVIDQRPASSTPECTQNVGWSSTRLPGCACHMPA